MKLRTKIIIFFGMFLLAIVIAVVLYGQYFAGAAIKKQETESLRIYVEQAEGTYYTFLRSIKRETLDWSFDPQIQRITEDIITSKAGTPKHEKAVKEFSLYVASQKMAHDSSAIITDLLDGNGIVVASTNPSRVGVDEAKEEARLNSHYFSKTITANYGEAFSRSIIFEQDQSTEPIIHITTRIFKDTYVGSVTHEPMDAVLLVHFTSINDIGRAISGDTKDLGGATPTKTFLTSYKTSQIYLVNGEKFMVTPSRDVLDIKQMQKVDTVPIRECLDNKSEVNREYNNYRGETVLGSSVCLDEDGLILVAEVSKDEIFAPVKKLVNLTIIGGGVAFLFGMLVIIFSIRSPLRNLKEIIFALKGVMNGDFTTQVVIRSKDEISLVASMFNTMISAIRESQKNLEDSKHTIEEKALVLQKNVEEHEKQEKFLDQSKKATLNLLEDAWKTKEKLEEEGRRLQAILSSVSDGLFIIDSTYRVTLANPAILRMFGLSREELIGKDLREVVTLWKKRSEVVPVTLWPIEEVFLTKKTIELAVADDFSISTEKRPEKLPVVFSIASLNIGTTNNAVIVLRDVTKDRELDDAKSGFISVASHQLRTPLTSIRWYSEMLLLEDAGPLNDVQKDFMKEVHGGAERLYQTVDLLLGISRVESGKMKTDKITIDLWNFTAEITKELGSQMNEKELELRVVPPDTGPVTVFLDSLTLRQVILNLISNAIRYTKIKGLIEIKWWINNDAREVVYMVHDNGIGIPESQRPRIFSKFFRAENARAQVPDGSGLGLALVKDLVEEWGGKVWFDTALGQGTTFFFTVPF